jgi:hypothetical protein
VSGRMALRAFEADDERERDERAEHDLRTPGAAASPLDARLARNG